MKISLYFILTLLFILAIFGFAQAQKNTITLLDQKSKLPVAYAHIAVKGLKSNSEQYLLSGENGRSEILIMEASSVSISFVGYQLFTDTIQPGENITVMLYPATFDVDEVVVTGQLEPIRVDKSIYKIKVISSKEIMDRAANNMNELMSTELKFRTFNDGILGSSISIQGLSGNNVKILIDGVPVIGREGGNIDLNQLNLSNVDHIEIVEGPLSVIYGSNSLAGAINLITKENKYYRNKFTLNNYYESVGVYNVDALVTTKKKNSTYTLSGGRYFNQEFDINPELRSTLWKPKEQYFSDFKYQYNSKKSKLSVTTSLLREFLLDKSEPYDYYKENVTDVHLTSYRGTLTASYDRFVASDKLLSYVASYSTYYRLNDKYSKDLTTLDQIQMSSDKTIANALLFRGLWKNFGEGKKFNYQFGYDSNIETGWGDKIEGGKKNMGNYAIFWSGQIKPTSKINFQPGIRVSYNTDFESPLVPSLNIKWSPNEIVDIRASYVRGFRAPTLKELYMDFFDSNHNIRGNTELKAEHGNNFNLALNFNTDKLHKIHYSNVKVDFYYNRMENNIELAQMDEATLFYSYVNIANFSTLGGFIQFSYKFHPFMKFSAGIGRNGFTNSLGEEQFKLDDYLFGTDVSGEVQFTLVRFDTDISFFYKYNGKLPQFSFGDEQDLEYSYMGEYHTMDVSLNKRFWMNKINLSLGVKNLFDNYNIESFGIGGGVHSGGGSMPVSWGRTWFVKLNLNLNSLYQSS
jgi:outer membrane receptor for ferrienterochelin and colicins